MRVAISMPSKLEKEGGDRQPSQHMVNWKKGWRRPTLPSSINEKGDGDLQPFKLVV
jgi:hypothetical protein